MAQMSKCHLTGFKRVHKDWYPCVLIVDKVLGDGIEDTLPQSLALLHSNYFKLKELEKWQVLEGLSDLPLRQVIRPSSERCPPHTGGREHPYLCR